MTSRSLPSVSAPSPSATGCTPPPPTGTITAGWTLQEVLITLSKGYHHCDRLSELLSPTAKPPRHAAYNVMLADSRAERWARAYRSSREEKQSCISVTSYPYQIGFGNLVSLLIALYAVNRREKPCTC